MRKSLFIISILTCLLFSMISCSTEAVSADPAQFLGIPMLTTSDAEKRIAGLTESHALPELLSSEWSSSALSEEITKHTVPLAGNDKTPAYYLPLNPDTAVWDAITLSAAGCTVYLVSDKVLPDKTTALADGYAFTLLFCGERYYSYASLVCTGLPMLTVDLYSEKEGKIIGDTDIIRRMQTMIFSFYDGADPTAGGIVSAQCAGQIRTRGGTSLTYEKHSFKFSLYDDVSLTDQHNLSMCGLRMDDDWILNAMYQEETKVRDMLAYDLWEDIGMDYYGDDGRLGTRMRYVELILGGRYWGLYGLCEPLDAKQAGISETNPGQIYKVGNWGVPSISDIQNAIRNQLDVIDTIELKYPDPPENYRDAWVPFMEYVELSDYDGSDFSFRNLAPEIIDMGNLTDIWIFLNLMTAKDNQWKNLYLYHKETDNKIVMAPWDCDLTFGLEWDQHSYLHMPHTPSTFDDICDVPIIIQYLDLDTNEFRDAVAARWQELHNTWLSAEEIISRARTFRALLEDSGALMRNHAKWKRSGYIDNLDFLEEYINFRIPFLDQYVEKHFQ